MPRSLSNFLKQFKRDEAGIQHSSSRHHARSASGYPSTILPTPRPVQQQPTVHSNGTRYAFINHQYSAQPVGVMPSSVPQYTSAPVMTSVPTADRGPWTLRSPAELIGDRLEEQFPPYGRPVLHPQQDFDQQQPSQEIHYHTHNHLPRRSFMQRLSQSFSNVRSDGSGTRRV
jgi:hypothetical protein